MPSLQALAEPGAVAGATESSTRHGHGLRGGPAACTKGSLASSSGRHRRTSTPKRWHLFAPEVAFICSQVARTCHRMRFIYRCPDGVGSIVRSTTHTLDLSIDTTSWGRWNTKGPQGQIKATWGHIQATPGANKCHLLGVVLGLVSRLTQPADLTPSGRWDIKGTRGQIKATWEQIKATPGANKCHLLGVVLDLVFAVTQPASLPSHFLPDSPHRKKNVTAGTTTSTSTRHGLARPGPHVNLSTVTMAVTMAMVISAAATYRGNLST